MVLGMFAEALNSILEIMRRQWDEAGGQEIPGVGQVEETEAWSSIRLYIRTCLYQPAPVDFCFFAAQ